MDSDKASDILWERHNLRSTTGLVCREESSGKTYLHFKRADQTLIDQEKKSLRRALTVTSTVSGITPIPLREEPSEQEILWTEYVPNAQSLFNYVWNGSGQWFRRRLTPIPADELGSRLGKWLRVYHDSSQVVEAETGPYVTQIAKGVRGRLQVAARHQPQMVSSGFLKRVDTILESAVTSCESQGEQYVAIVHGDYDLANILVTSEGHLFVLDFTDSRTELALFDMVRIWHGLWSISAISHRRTQVLQPCLASLLQSYDQTTPIIRSPLFTIMRLFNAAAQILISARAPKALGFSGNRVARKLANINIQWIRSLPINSARH